MCRPNHHRGGLAAFTSPIVRACIDWRPARAYTGNVPSTNISGIQVLHQRGNATIVFVFGL